MKLYELPDLGKVVFLEPGDDIRPALELRRSGVPVAFDTETSGLAVYAEGFELRLCQFGSADVAYVYRPGDFPDLTMELVTTGPVWMHNADYDTRVLDHCLGIPLESTWPNVLDSSILSRLIDPRDKAAGGIGHGLKELSTERLGLEVADARKKVMEAGRAYKLRKESDVWQSIPDTDPIYVQYAGQDVLLCARLGPALLRGIAEYELKEVSSLEHAVAYCVSTLVRKGWRIDREYAADALKKFDAEYHAAEEELAGLGITPTKTGNYASARAGLIARFTELGVQFKETTDAGAPKLDEEILQKIHESRQDAASVIAGVVIKAKKAQKNAAFVKGFLEAADPNARVHAVLNPLGARTGRMSCSMPNLQNIPRDVPETRGCFIAEEGEVLLSVDYSAIEWRIAAGVTQDAQMMKVFREGGDIHADVARIVFGEDFTDAQRQQCKSVGLGRLYGGGVDTLVRQSGLPRDKVEEAVATLDLLYPGIRAKVREAYDMIDGPTAFTLASGRRAITDAAYRKLNLDCQGPARDVLAYAMLRIFEAGLGEHLVMLVHDEMIFSVPELEAKDYQKKIVSILESEFLGVKITADGKEKNILGRHWKKS